MQELIPYIPIPTKHFDAQSALKVDAFLHRKLKSTIPTLKKLGKEKYSLYGVTKKQLGFLLKDELLNTLLKMEHSEKLYLSEHIFIYHYKKNVQVEFAIGVQEAKISESQAISI
ncbi:MAG: hypothetical protein IPP32_16660 [Bacteroidetes bacterium]|nr:hypothetical protein [Bacteroidota bacterium]